MNPDTPCTEDDIKRIVAAAIHRQGYLHWIAAKLLVTDDIHIRRAAAEALLQLTENP